MCLHTMGAFTKNPLRVADTGGMTMRQYILIGWLCFASVVLAQQVVIETPASRVFQAWLAAFNSGDTAKYNTFDVTYKPTRLMSQMADFRIRTGGFTLMRIEKNEATAITALVKEKESDSIARLELTISADDPPKLLATKLQLIPPPADLAVARLSQIDALAAWHARKIEV